MAKLSILAGATSQSVNVFIQDSSVTTGAGLTGLLFNTASLTAYYNFTGANAAATAITLATLAAVNSAYSSGGFKEIDATNMPGLYRLDIPNAALAAAKGQSVAILLKGAANMVPVVLEIELTATNNQDGVHFGLTAIPNAVAGASAGLHINGSNAGTTTFAALTITGTTTMSDGLVVNRSTANASAIVATGNGTGSGGKFVSGAGATGNGFEATSASTNGHGFVLTATGTGNAFRAASASGDAILTTVATSGHGATFAGTGTTKHGINATGGATSSDGIRATGGGVGNGLNAISGAGATGDGIVATAASTNGSGLTAAKTGTGKDLNATSTPLTLAKTTNITGFNDIAATAIVSGGAITTASGVANANAVQWGGTATGTVPPDAVFARGNTAQGGGATSITLDAGASAINDIYKNMTVYLALNTGAVQANLITAYNGTTKVATVANTWAVNPDNTTFFIIMPFGPAQVAAPVTLTTAYDFAKGTVALTESYAALHSVPTPSQILLEMRALLAENSVASTTVTVKKIDGSTVAETFTIDSATTPAAITRAT